MELFGRPARPGDSRGIAPLIIAALAAGAGRAVIGGITANQTKQRNKGYINASYRTASQRLDDTQDYARQDIAESLNERGLAQAGDVSASPIRTAMLGDKMVAGTTSATPGVMHDSLGRTIPISTPTVTPSRASTIGGQQISDAGVQMGLERKDLDQKHDQALRENKAEYANSLLGAGAAGAQTGEEVYGMGKDVSAGNTADAAAAGSRSRIHAAMLSGFGVDGVNVNDPIGEPTSAWSTHPRSRTRTRLADADDISASFNV